MRDTYCLFISLLKSEAYLRLWPSWSLPQNVVILGVDHNVTAPTNHHQHETVRVPITTRQHNLKCWQIVMDIPNATASLVNTSITNTALCNSLPSNHCIQSSSRSFCQTGLTECKSHPVAILCGHTRTSPWLPYGIKHIINQNFLRWYLH